MPRSQMRADEAQVSRRSRRDAVAREERGPNLLRRSPSRAFLEYRDFLSRYRPEKNTSPQLANSVLGYSSANKCVKRRDFFFCFDSIFGQRRQNYTGLFGLLYRGLTNYFALKPSPFKKKPDLDLHK